MGGSGIDFASMDGGDYRVTIARTGQVNFQYGDGQYSAPQSANLQLTANSAAPLGYATVATDYIATATVTLQNPLPGEVSSYTSQFRFHSSTLPGMFFSNLSFDSSVAPPGNKQLVFQSDTVNLNGSNVNGGAFDLTSLSRGTLSVDSNSLISQARDYSVAPTNQVFFGSQFSDFSSDFGAMDNPEPATFVLMGGALLAGLGLSRFRAQSR